MLTRHAHQALLQVLNPHGLCRLTSSLPHNRWEERGGFLRLVAPFFFFLASAPVAHVFIEKQPYDKQAEPDNGPGQGP